MRGWTKVSLLLNYNTSILPLSHIALTRQDIELILSEEELTVDGQTGQASWISTGLKVEESQYVL